MPTTTAPIVERTELPLLRDCCSPIVRQIIPAADAETLAARFKAVFGATE